MTRDHRLIAVFTLLAVLAGSGAWAGTLLEDPAAVPVVSDEVRPVPSDRVSVQFVGDTHLGDEMQRLSDQRGGGFDWVFDAMRPAMTGDYIIANAEGPISNHTTPWNPAKKYSYGSRPEAASALARVGVDAVTLANNHSYDLGPEGLADTIRYLNEVGIAAVGAGPTLTHAERPLLLHTDYGTLGVVSIGESFGYRAAEDRSGTLVLSPETVDREAALARAAGADWIIAAVHWGTNYGQIDGLQRRYARMFADAGFDLVIGHGPHIAQPIEVIGAMPVVYSMGNFVFGAPGRYAQYEKPGISLSVQLELSRGGPPRLSVRCLVTDNLLTNFQPRPCTAEEAQISLPAVSPDLDMQGDTGFLRCDGCFVRRRDA